MKKNKKILGLDIGTKRTGTAVFSHGIVFPRETFKYKNFRKILEAIKSFCEQEGVALIVVGLPIDEEGNERKITKFVKKCAEELKMKTGLPIEFVDEAFSTEEGISKMPKYNKEERDSAAACVILERYMATLK